jgi:hypothetical protein
VQPPSGRTAHIKAFPTPDIWDPSELIKLQKKDVELRKIVREIAQHEGFFLEGDILHNIIRINRCGQNHNVTLHHNVTVVIPPPLRVKAIKLCHHGIDEGYCVVDRFFFIT